MKILQISDRLIFLSEKYKLQIVLFWRLQHFSKPLNARIKMCKHSNSMKKKQGCVFGVFWEYQYDRLKYKVQKHVA